MGTVPNLSLLGRVTVPDFSMGNISTPSTSRAHQTSDLTTLGPKWLFSLNLSFENNDTKEEHTWIYSTDWPAPCLLYSLGPAPSWAYQARCLVLPSVCWASPTFAAIPLDWAKVIFCLRPYLICNHLCTYSVSGCRYCAQYSRSSENSNTFLAFLEFRGGLAHVIMGGLH